VYNAFVVYTTPVMLQTGAGAPLLFSVAMALHFLMTDDVFEKHFPQRSTRWGRIPLVGGPLFGWVAVALFGPTSTLLLSVVTAFLGGAILLNVFSWELTPRPDSSFALVLGRARPLCSARHRPHDFSKVEAA
jgi:hypothetical protein